MFSLEKVNENHFYQLCKVLWSWPHCEHCQNSQSCETEDCSLRRSIRLGKFFLYYKDLIASYQPDVGPNNTAALTSHEDLFNIIQQLKLHCEVSRTDFVNRVFANHPSRRAPPSADQECAVNLAVKTMIMVNCSAQHQSSGLLEHGAYQIPWRGDSSFSQFILDVFPMTDHPSLNDDDTKSPLDMKAALQAKKLKNRLKLKFLPTDDIRRHLKLDRRKNTIDVYHHTAFLKEHLRLTRNEERNMSVGDYLKLGALPRQLALECLDSIQKILFPLSDRKSRSMLQSLVSTSGFDPDCLRFESVSIRNADEKEITYHYFGAQLADLYEETRNPTPRGLVEKWLERKSGARYIMMATLIGVILAVILGIAQLAVGGYQAWVGYQQWQHPRGTRG